MATKRYVGWTDRDTAKKGYADLDNRFSSYNTKAEGLVCDGVADDRALLNTLANATMQPNGGDLDIVGVVRIGSDVTFPSNVKLNFVDGAYLAPDIGVTVTINGKLRLTHAKIFGGAGTIVFGATARTGVIRPEWWGALGDGATDDATPIFASFTAAKPQGRKVQFGAKNYRVTTGFTNNINYHDMVIEGKSSSRETNNNQGTQITLDSNNPATFFYSHSSRHHLQVRNITFKCTQYALDRAFFQFTTTNWHTFENVDFEGVERPIVYKAGSYFQNASFTNVAFSNSGTIHSETTALVGTLLRLNNVNHEGTTPANTPKVMMNLQGVRHIVGENVLLEGTVPAVGWGGINFDLNSAGAGISTQAAVDIRGLWIEVPGTPLSYTGRFNGVTARFSLPQGLVIGDGSPTAILDKGSVVVVEGAVLLGAPMNLNNLATFNDIYSQLIIGVGCKVRSLANLTNALTNKQIKLLGAVSVIDDVANSVNGPVSTVDNEILFEWKGGKLSNQKFVAHPAQASFAHLRTIITDATYGRLININPNGQTFAQWQINITCPAEWAGLMLRVQMYAKFRTRVGGTFQNIITSGAVNPTLIAAVTEEAFDWYNLAVRVPAGGGLINILQNTNGVIAADIQIAALRVSLGDSFGRFPSLEKPLRVEFEDTVAPATGTWAVGDRAKNSAPAVGSPKAWSCTVAGTPGTWVSEGNL